MKPYHYLLFRIYMFYKQFEKETHYSFSTSIVSTILLYINLLSFYFLLVCLDFIADFFNKYTIVLFMLIIWLCNYFLLVRKEEFLKQVISALIFPWMVLFLIGLVNSHPS